MNKSQCLLLFAVLIWSFSATNLLAQIVLETTYPGKSALGCCPPWDFKANFDLNDDGIPDQPLMVEEGIYFLTILDGAHPENAWYLPELDDEVVLSFSQTSVLGFFEWDSTNDLKEIILAEKLGRQFINPVIIDAEGRLLWKMSNAMLLTIRNMDADVTEEIVVFNPQIPQVEVWGMQTD